MCLPHRANLRRKLRLRGTARRFGRNLMTLPGAAAASAPATGGSVSSRLRPWATASAFAACGESPSLHHIPRGGTIPGWHSQGSTPLAREALHHWEASPPMQRHSSCDFCFRGENSNADTPVNEIRMLEFTLTARKPLVKGQVAAEVAAQSWEKWAVTWALMSGSDYSRQLLPTTTHSLSHRLSLSKRVRAAQTHKPAGNKPPQGTM